jgi:hypothetical protein
MPSRPPRPRVLGPRVLGPRMVGSRALGLLVVVLAAVGCAGVPTSGPVHVGRAVTNDSTDGEDIVQQIPPGPSEGMNQVGTVTGFLFALSDSDYNYGIARRFIAPGASLKPASGTTVYSESSLIVTQVDATEITASFRRIATIDANGHYRIDPGAVTVHFTLVREPDRQWRISKLPSGVMLSTTDVQRSLRPASVYFLNLPATRVVPDPLLVPRDQRGLATTLIQQLLAGPSHDLAPGVQTAAPEGTGLVGTVPVDGNGVAEINLAGGAQKISASAVGRLSAQIDWTLRQVPTVRAVRLLDNGAPLTAVGVAATQPIGSWPQFDPEAPPTSHGLLASDRGQVVGIGAAVPPALALQMARSPVTSADGEEAAAVTGTGADTRLLVGASAGPLHSIALDPPLSTPAFDPLGHLFVVSGQGTAARLVEVSTTLVPHQVQVPSSITELGLDAVSISRDGSRIALVVGPAGRSELLVGGLGAVHDEARVDGLWVAVPATRSVMGLTWAGSNEIVTTVSRPHGRREAFETSVDGYKSHLVSDAGLPGSVTAVTQAPGKPLVGAVGTSMYALTGRVWHRLAGGVDPSYAG